MQSLWAWLEPFKLQHHHVDFSAVERETQEKNRLLRQMRAELKLMKRWRDTIPSEGSIRE